MNDLAIDALKAEIRGHINGWKGRLLLYDWNIIVHWYHDQIPGFAESAAGVSTPDWRYMEATLKWNLEKLDSLTPVERERVVVHELLHCLTNAACKTGSAQEEHLVTRLALVLVPHREEIHEDG